MDQQPVTTCKICSAPIPATDEEQLEFSVVIPFLIGDVPPTFGQDVLALVATLRPHVCIHRGGRVRIRYKKTEKTEIGRTLRQLAARPECGPDMAVFADLFEETGAFDQAHVVDVTLEPL